MSSELDDKPVGRAEDWLLLPNLAVVVAGDCVPEPVGWWKCVDVELDMG